MGDSEDIMEKAEQFVMNNFEKDRYEEHIENIKSLEKRVSFWKIINIIFQVIFFWNIVAFGFEAARDITSSYSPSMSSFFNSVSITIEPVTLLFVFISAFAFFLMIWTGIIRGKWEGKLTRASAYALAFISNIEHRDYDDRMARQKAQLLTRPVRKK